jgi:hypothetical protein
MQKPKGIPVPTDSRTLPRLTKLVAVARDRRRSPNATREAVTRRVRDELRAMAHVLRVRSRLTGDEQRSFDQLVTAHAETMLGMLIERSADEATEAVRRHLASVSHMRASPHE